MDQSDFTFFAGQAKRCFDLASTCGNRAVADALSQMARHYLAAAVALPRAALRKAAWELAEHRDFEAPWRRDPLDRAAELAELVAGLGRLAELAPDERDPADWLDKLLVSVRRDVFEDETIVRHVIV